MKLVTSSLRPLLFAPFAPFALGAAQASGPMVNGTTQVDVLSSNQASCSPSWQSTFGAAPGTNNPARALAVFDDGRGAGPALYVGGQFTSAGGVAVNRIAKWDGATWSALGSGMDNWVECLAVFDDGSGPALYAGGRLTFAGGGTANHIAKWDGSSWSPLGSGTNNDVLALAVFDDGSGGGPALYAGGSFTSAGGLDVSYIAKWSGSTWSSVKGMSNTVNALTVFDDGMGAGSLLYAGGSFVSAGSTPANRIAKWNGTDWAALGSGLTSGASPTVYSLTVFDDGGISGPALFVGGAFTLAGTNVANGIAKWNGLGWSALGVGVTSSRLVRALTVFDDGNGGGDALFVGGNFLAAGGINAQRIAKWDGANWSQVGGGIQTPSSSNAVHALAVFDDGGGPCLFAAGAYDRAGQIGIDNTAKWNGSNWFSLGTGLSDDVQALAVFDDGTGPGLYAGGFLGTAGGMAASRIAKWDGAAWSPLSSGLNAGAVTAMQVYDDGGGASLYVGGGFTKASGHTTNRVAQWNGSNWGPLGVGTNNTPNAMKVFDDGSGPALFIGGSFSQAGGVNVFYIAKWNGNWGLVGSGLNSWCNALEVFDDGNGEALYAGGLFTSAGGVAANRIAKWDGTSWSPLGIGTVGSVRAMKVFDDGGGPDLYVGGDFTIAGGLAVNRIARWNGSAWSVVGQGFNDSVWSLTVFDDGRGGGPALYAGGEFTMTGPQAASRIAKWNGTSWESLGAQMNGHVRTLMPFDDGSGAGAALYAGGLFTASAAGDSFLAKWGCNVPQPFDKFCTAKTTSFCGAANISANGTPSASATSGFVIKAQPVRGCRGGLLLYSNQNIVSGVPFGGPGNGVLCLFAMGLRRAGPIQSGSMPQFCDGTLAIDMNRFRSQNWTAVGCNPPPGQNNPAGYLGNMGTTVNAQMWGRDSVATGQVLSDGIIWSVGP